MKRIVVVTILLTMIFCPILKLRAESNQGRNDVSIQAGGIFFEGDSNLKKDNGTVGFRIGHYITNKLAFEGALFFANTQLKDTKSATDVMSPSIGARYDLGSSRFRPFLFVGASQLSVSPNVGNSFTHFALDLGVGARYELIKDIALRIDAHDIVDTESGKGTHSAMLTGGLVFAFDQLCGCESPQATTRSVPPVVQTPPPPAPAKVAETPKPVVVPDVTTKDNWVLEGVNFETNSDKLTAASTSVLNEAAETLKSHPKIRVEVQGHTDNMGDDRYNENLSDRRALTVKNFLIAHGVAANRLESKGYGETKPIADNKTSDGRAKNRRIEFKVLSR